MTLYLSVSPDPGSQADRCVEVLESLGRQAMERSGRYIVSLAGGSTPRAVYERWGQASALDWSKVVLLFGDERCVPADDPQSNYRMVQKSLLAGLKAQPTVHRMEGEHADPAQAARAYEAGLRALLGEDGRIHVALLGVGGDGHTASLFPGSPALKESDALCVSTRAPEGGMNRLSLTIPCLRDAHKLMFLAAGREKAEILQQVLEGHLDPERLPAQFFLRDDRLNVNLLLDKAAATRLSQRPTV